MASDGPFAPVERAFSFSSTADVSEPVFCFEFDLDSPTAEILLNERVNPAVFRRIGFAVVERVERESDKFQDCRLYRPAGANDAVESLGQRRSGSIQESADHGNRPNTMRMAGRVCRQKACPHWGQIHGEIVGCPLSDCGEGHAARNLGVNFAGNSFVDQATGGDCRESSLFRQIVESRSGAGHVPVCRRNFEIPLMFSACAIPRSTLYPWPLLG